MGPRDRRGTREGHPLTPEKGSKKARNRDAGGPREGAGDEAVASAGGALFRSIVENSSEVVKIVDPDGTLRYASPAVGRVLGYDPGKMVGQNVLDFVHPEDLPLVVSETERAMAEPGVGRSSAAYRFRHADGTWRHVESTGTYLLDDPAVGGVIVVTRDVTARKRAEEAEQRLRRVEEEYRALVETVPAITYVFAQEPGGESVPRYVSPQVKRILGYTPEEYVSDPGLWRRVLHPEDRERVLAEDVNTGKTGETFRQGFRMVARDGGTAWFREEGWLVRTDEDGALIWHGVMFDVTELKETEMRLRRAEGRFRNLVERVPPVVYVQRPNEAGAAPYDVTYMSPRAERLFGYPGRAFVEDPGLWDRLIHPDDLAAVAAEDERTDRTGESFSMEYRMRRRDGGLVWVRDEAVLIRGGEGETPYWQGVMSDVTERKRSEEELEASEERYRSVVEAVKEVVFRTDAEGRWTFLSPAWQEITGFTAGESIGESYLGFVHPDDLERNLRDLEGMGEHGEGHNRYEARFRTKDGGSRWLEVNFREHFGEDGALVGTSGTLDDVSERREAEERLKESEERYRALVEQVPAVNYTLESVSAGGTMIEGRVLYIGPQVERVLGHPPEAFTSDRGFWTSLVHREDLERVLEEDRRTDETGEPFSAEYRMVHGDGRTVWIRDEAALVRDGDGLNLYWQGVFLDVTERKMLEQELERQATHDPLTGLPNRALLSERLGQAIHRAKRRDLELAVLFVDLDDFKEVNDSLGHDAGDRVLAGVAGRLRETVRPEDSVARLGGDEFVVLLEDADRGQALSVAARIGTALGSPFYVGAERVVVTASVGVAPGGPGAAGPEELLRNADRAMYRAKESGKNRNALID